VQSSLEKSSHQQSSLQPIDLSKSYKTSIMFFGGLKVNSNKVKIFLDILNDLEIKQKQKKR
jgi:hypothetical protein